ncbi:MAG: sugar phosphate isomerase/epimerase [Firmicutes bacterium]|nr:sugar phosphate isomerase/epimerase [Bacillota bacterium]
MRLGAALSKTYEDPEVWAADLQRGGYTAAVWPLGDEADEETVLAFARAAEKAGIVIAEVGAWSNPIGPDERVRKEAIEFCRRRLALADRIGAVCCVNIAGSRGGKWDGPHPENLTQETFDLIVETVRAIIDAVKPTRTCYTLEPMPWVYPHTVESYLALIAAIDRPRFAVHLDPVNLIWSPERFYTNGALIEDCFARLGPYIKSCHAKDIVLREDLTVHLEEVRPGLGGLDYRAYLWSLAGMDPDLPLIIEHLPTEEDYAAAAGYIRGLAGELGVPLR